jgi:hypothetical protein
MRRYRVKVRGRVYLWGSAGIDTNSDLPLLLSVRVDDFGEPVTLEIKRRGEDELELLGTLQPGETYTLPITQMQGLAGFSNVDSCVYCSLTPLVPSVPS